MRAGIVGEVLDDVCSARFHRTVRSAILLEHVVHVVVRFDNVLETEFSDADVFAF